MAVSHEPSRKTIPFRERLTCTVAEACAATGLGRTTLDRLRLDGRLDTLKVDGRRLVRVPSLLALLDPPAAQS